jgi:hypothetical protein
MLVLPFAPEAAAIESDARTAITTGWVALRKPRRPCDALFGFRAKRFRSAVSPRTAFWVKRCGMQKRREDASHSQSFAKLDRRGIGFCAQRFRSARRPRIAFRLSRCAFKMIRQFYG